MTRFPSCSRCGCYLGDGQFIQDPSCKDAETCAAVHPAEAADRRLENPEFFHPVDLSDVRLCLHTVDISYKASSNLRDSSIPALQSISTEQVLAFLHSLFWINCECRIFSTSTIAGNQQNHSAPKLSFRHIYMLPILSHCEWDVS